MKVSVVELHSMKIADTLSPLKPGRYSVKVLEVGRDKQNGGYEVKDSNYDFGEFTIHPGQGIIVDTSNDKDPEVVWSVFLKYEDGDYITHSFITGKSIECIVTRPVFGSPILKSTLGMPEYRIEKRVLKMVMK